MKKERIFKYVVIILSIILVLFVGNIIRKTYIISKWNEKSQEYSKITNFYKKYKEDNESTVEIWKKDNISLYKRTSKDGVRIIYNNIDEKIGWLINDTKTGDEINKVAIRINENELDNLYTANLLDNEIDINNLGQAIKAAFMCSITSENYFGAKCYKINFQNELTQYINKENYLCIGTVTDHTDTGLIEYKINEVKDEEVKLPDLSNFEIKED